MIEQYADVELKIMQYVQWLRQGDELRRLGYPKCVPVARLIPRELPADAVPSIGDEEGIEIGRAMMVLKSVDRVAHSVIVERYFWGIESDVKIGRILGIADRKRVGEIRRRAFSNLRMYFEAHKLLSADTT